MYELHPWPTASDSGQVLMYGELLILNTHPRANIYIVIV